MPKKTIEVDSKMLDLAVDELSKLMVRLDKSPKIGAYTFLTRISPNSAYQMLMIRSAVATIAQVSI